MPFKTKETSSFEMMKMRWQPSGGKKNEYHYVNICIYYRVIFMKQLKKKWKRTWKIATYEDENQNK